MSYEDTRETHIILQKSNVQVRCLSGLEQGRRKSCPKNNNKVVVAMSWLAKSDGEGDVGR